MGREGANGNRRKLAAALLWHMITPALRIKVSRFLTLHELTILTDFFQNYRRSEKSHRLSVERYLGKSISRDHSRMLNLYTVIGFLLALLFYLLHKTWEPKIGDALRLQLLAPALLGAFSLLVVRILPRYQIPALFSLKLSMNNALILLPGFIGLLWVMAYLKLQVNPALLFRPRGLSLVILSYGAATAPLMEEVIFRQIIPYMIWSPRRPDTLLLAHSISATLFALAHLPDTLTLFVLYIFAGLFLSGIRMISGGLSYPLISHILANEVAILLL